MPLGEEVHEEHRNHRHRQRDSEHVGEGDSHRAIDWARGALERGKQQRRAQVDDEAADAKSNGTVKGAPEAPRLKAAKGSQDNVCAERDSEDDAKSLGDTHVAEVGGRGAVRLQDATTYLHAATARQSYRGVTDP